MKKIITMLALLCAILFAQSEPKIAIHITGEIGANEKKALSTKMLSSFINSGRFKAIEREDAFRQSQIQAQADNSLLSSYGREYGASHVCMVDITQVLGSYQVSARVIDVGTEKVISRSEASSPLRTIEDLGVVSDKIIAGINEALPPMQALPPPVYIPPPVPSQVQAQPEQPVQQQPEQPVQQQPEEPSFPRHTITVDIVPTVMGIIIGGIGKEYIDKALKDAKGQDDIDVSADISGLGIAVQYEFQPLERMSLAARFAYLGFGASMTQTEEDGLEAKLKGDISLTSVEGHIRTYPFAGAFFFDAVLGYTSLGLSFKGEDIVENDDGVREIESTKFSASQGFFKPGLKLGWRISFGKNGGFTFEPAFNFCYAMRLGNSSIIKQIMKDTENDYSEDMKDLDDTLKLIESIGLIGGPGFSLSFGYRF